MIHGFFNVVAAGRQTRVHNLQIAAALRRLLRG
jgi:hypothetical protein